MLLSTERERATTERSLTLKRNSSQWEMLFDGQNLKDPVTAHSEGHDPDGDKFLPETCFQCWAEAKAREELEKATDTSRETGGVEDGQS